MTPTPFTQALTSDMARLELNERQLGHRLGVSQQAIGKWLKQGFPPRRRVSELVEIFGAHSAVASLTPVQMYQEPLETPVAGAPPRKAQDTLAVRKHTLNALRNFTAYLPPALHGHAERKVTLQTADGPRTLVLDYASDRLLLEVVVRTQGGPLSTVSPAVTRLLATARVHRAKPPRTVLALLSDMPDEDAKRGESVVLAQALGVEMWVCHSWQDLAARVLEAEGLDVETQDEDTECCESL